jgi:ATP-dependent Clp protease adaptor protein ClpS
MTTDTDVKITVKIKPKEDVPEPTLYKVIYINDEVTTQDFVTETLVLIFNYSQSEAEAMTLKIHENGSAVVAVYPYEMAEQKGVEVTLLAKTNGFPLVVKLEPES